MQFKRNNMRKENWWKGLLNKIVRFLAINSSHKAELQNAASIISLSVTGKYSHLSADLIPDTTLFWWIVFCKRMNFFKLRLNIKFRCFFRTQISEFWKCSVHILSLGKLQLREIEDFTLIIYIYIAGAFRRPNSRRQFLSSHGICSPGIFGSSEPPGTSIWNFLSHLHIHLNRIITTVDAVLQTPL